MVLVSSFDSVNSRFRGSTDIISWSNRCGATSWDSPRGSRGLEVRQEAVRRAAVVARVLIIFAKPSHGDAPIYSGFGGGDHARMEESISNQIGTAGA
jgi:hypothetical protein